MKIAKALTAAFLVGMAVIIGFVVFGIGGLATIAWHWITG